MKNLLFILSIVFTLNCFGQDKIIKIHADGDYSINSSLANRCSSYINDEPLTLDWLESFDEN